MIEVKDLHKSYGRQGKVNALNSISFTVDDGEIFGVIGPDGAGKSSLFRILASLILPDSGSAIMNGHDVVKDYRKIRQIIGYMPGRFSLYQDLSVEENLTFFATLFNTTIEENYHLIKDIYQQIEPFKNRRAGALSGGMKQKLALSCALIHKPEILILDEPTTGVDPVSRKEFWDMLGRLKDQGITILVSTAYMDEASRCDRIALIREGKFIASGTPQRIIDDYSEILWAVEGTGMSALLRELRTHEKVKSSFAFGDQIHITVEEGLHTGELKQYLANKNFNDVRIAQIEPTVEDCFMALTS
ncbi:MAG TPA: ABC transporter ATP-binding protein [Petrimonas sp.]|uniref:ABC transporter ATP-binding protein n=1 Tax=Petrimonas sp. TaxID=2023866 RepID=UPI00176383A7|nr:ABC transporter ATP-binding protein [Petrimonas sp.]MEA5045483.1 ABC transporter ATP-binding protein [Petrimonas sp.]MEA5064349.1 ABC transporter ATP-binding protein [Petrimonas sp.]HHV84223.1 ABC transporter ATP-binding protein [Petrimonas sp.]